MIDDCNRARDATDLKQQIEREPLFNEQLPETVPLYIQQPRLSVTASGLCRVETVVDGYAVWIESREALACSAEAFVAAFLLPAMSSGRQIVTSELDQLFEKNVRLLQQRAGHWWASISPIEIRGEPSSVKAKREKSGIACLFFTGGVDSFFSLKRHNRNLQALINVRGFDIPLADHDRIARTSELLHEVGKSVHLPVVEVSTNLREHPTFRRLNWEITHIAAIASVAHCLSTFVSTAYVASSDVPPPWGSHPDLDPLWSSNRLGLVNDGSSFSRFQKVQALAGWRIVNDHLRVCWENRSQTLNCGVCEKCVRTQAQFIAAGANEIPAAFPNGPLLRRIDELPAAPGPLREQWHELVVAAPDGELAASIVRLLARSS